MQLNQILRALAVALLVVCGGNLASAQVACTYDANGIATITFNGVTLEDTSAHPSDKFTVTHMQLEDLSGNLNETSGQIGSSHSWNASNHTMTYTFSWGSVSVAHTCTSSEIDMTTTIVNSAGSGTVFDGLEVFPFALHFPADPKNFYGFTQFAIGTLKPAVSIADTGSSLVVANVMPSAKVHLISGSVDAQSQGLVSGYAGWVNTGTNTYAPMMTTTLPAEGASFFPNNALLLQPGSSASFVHSIRFGTEASPPSIADALTSYAQAFPYQAAPGSHKPIGTMFFASNAGSNNLSVAGDTNINMPSGCGDASGNPRNYLNYTGGFDCTDNVATGGNSFQNMVLHRGLDGVQRAAKYGFGTIVTWDIEGQRYPQTTSYVCSPDQIDTEAPEMDQPVTDTDPTYAKYEGTINPATGQPWKLVDAYFDELTTAGLTIGVCIRPDLYVHFSTSTADPNNPSQTAPAGSSTQVFPQNSASGDQATANRVIAKIQYVKNRWSHGAPIFAYMDSWVYANGQVINPNVLQAISTALPNDILAEEIQHGQPSIRDWAYAKQFLNAEDNGDLSTTQVVPDYDPHLVYPKASSAILLNDMPGSAVQTDLPVFTAAVTGGDDLMVTAFEDITNDQTVANMYAALPPQTQSVNSVTDTFSGSSLGSNYTVLSGSFAVANNAVTSTSAGDSVAIRTGMTWSTSNLTVCEDLSNLGTGYQGGGPVLVTSVGQGYQFFVYQGGAFLQRYNNGGTTIATASGTFGASGTACLAYYNGALTATWNGATVASATDLTYSSSLIPGISFYEDNPSASATNFTVSSTPPPPPVLPAFATQPSSQTVYNGSGSVTLTAAATGSPTYQWQSAPSGSSTFTNISGATSASYITPTLTATTQYQVVATTGAGSVTSSVAIVTVSSGAPPACPVNAGHHCWYVRPDGGTRYDPNNTQFAGQCDGLHDAAYPGSGTNQPCAFSSPVFFYERGDYPGYNHWAGTGGDTYLIRGSLGSGVTYRIGWNNISQAQDNNGIFYGVPGDPYDSGIPSPPSGSAGAPTRILGENYAACTTTAAKTQLHGGYGAAVVLNMAGSSYVDAECLDITDFTSCGFSANLRGCNKNPGTLDDYANTGINWSNQSNYDTLTNVSVHGMAASGMTEPTGDGVVMTNISLVGNTASGWNAGGGSVGIGSTVVNGFNISWNGCAEEYPIVDALPYADCTDDQVGGYGDGFGTATIAILPNGLLGTAYTWQPPNFGEFSMYFDYSNNETFVGTPPYTASYDGTLPPGLSINASTQVLSGTPTTPGVYNFTFHSTDSLGRKWNQPMQLAVGNYAQGWQVSFNNGLVSYNTQDGLDALHLIGVGATMSVSNTLAYGNMGQQIKIGGGNDKVVNSVIVANCGAMGNAIPGTPSGFNSRLSDFCRAADTSVVIAAAKGATTQYAGNTLFTNNDTAVQVICEATDGACDSTSLMDFRDNIMRGYTTGGGEQPGQIYLTFPSDINPFTNPGSIYSHNVTYGGKLACPELDLNETNPICADPQLAGEATFATYGYMDPTPLAGSRVIGAGVVVTGITTDFTNATRSTTPAIGAMEATSTFALPGPVSTPITSNPVVQVVTKIIQGLRGLVGCRGCHF